MTYDEVIIIKRLVENARHSRTRESLITDLMLLLATQNGSMDLLAKDII